jgi:hypothetical protein
MALFMKDRSSNVDLTPEMLFGVPPDLSLVRQDNSGRLHIKARAHGVS